MPCASEIITKDLEILGGDEFLDDFPTVTRQSAIAALELAKSLVVGQLE